MISFPNCKINIGLRILGKREDGYHHLESVFYPVNWCDALEILPATSFSFETTGIAISGSTEDNLCVRAYRLLQQKFNLLPVKIFLLKNIPIGAGLGGGSSDAAFTLKMLNELFDLKLPLDQLRQYAMQLGSDCSFFLQNKPCLVTGKGEVLHPFALNLSGYQVLIVFPNLFVNTKWAYEKLSESRKKNSSKETFSDSKMENGRDKIISEVVNQPPEKWNEFLKNDFEAVVFRQYPQIEMIKKQLYESGAVYASMSGSGSAVYGIFRNEVHIKFDDSFKVFSGKL